MDAAQAAKLVLVQSVEAVDDEGEILSFEERRQANAFLEGEDAGSPLHAQLARTEWLMARVKRRADWLLHTAQALSGFPWSLTLLLGFFAILSGAGVQALGSGKSFHVLSVPFLGLLAWNFVSLVFLLLGPSLFRRRGRLTTLSQSVPTRGWGYGFMSLFLELRQRLWLRRAPSSERLIHNVSLRSLQRFVEVWPQHGGGLLRLQTARTLHLCMLLFCLSAIAVAYASGLTKSYHATAESTFLGTQQVVGLLKVLFVPSQWILGPLPSIQAGSQGQLGLAGVWIHHYALTLGLFVMVPRFLLLVGSWVLCSRLGSRLPLSLVALEEVPTLNVALASHTNVGKTSLARTLLRRDVGEVRDAEHVTRRRAGYFWVNSPNVRLRLWDTPGFGDAAALAEHLRKPQGWAWLRVLQDPKLRYDREAALSLQEEADLILYLVPAHGEDSVETMIRNEWEVLQQVGRPVLCILNRLEGADSQQETKLLERWRGFFANKPLCRGVLSLDAFSRTLKDEQQLFDAMEAALPEERKPLARRIGAEWKAQTEQRHLSASVTLAELLSSLKQDQEQEGRDRKQAAQRLLGRAERLIATAQDKIVEQMGLQGELRDRMITQAETYLRSIMPDRGERTWGAILGGAITGLASGVVTDLLAGGLTFFGGAALGTIAGALGGAGFAEGYRRIGKKGDRALAWDKDFLNGVALRLTLVYLAAASFGRARGSFTDEALARPEELNPAEDAEQVTALVQYQATLFEATEVALRKHWDWIWTSLEDETSGWVGAVQARLGNSQKGNESNQTQRSTRESQLEQRCSVLLEDALEQWGRLR